MPVDAKIARIWADQPQSVISTAIAISKAENGLRTCDRVNLNNNGSKDIGIFQINTVHQAKGNLYDCIENIRIAKQIYLRSGFNPWVTYKNGSYKNYE